MMNKKILIIVGVILVCFIAGNFLLLEQLPAQLQAQSTKELKLFDFPEAFKDSTLIVVGDNASEIELQAANEIADYLENKSGNKLLIKKHSEILKEFYWEENLTKNKELKMEFLIKSIKEGNWSIEAKAEYIAEWGGYGGMDIVYISVTENDTTVYENTLPPWMEPPKLPSMGERVGNTVDKPKPTSPLKINLKLIGKPLLNNTVKLLCTVKTDIDLQNITKIEITLPEGFEFIDGYKKYYNLIVIGTPKTNPLLEEVYQMTNATRATEEFPGEGKGVLEILPNPWNGERVMLLVEGWDEQSINLTSKRLTKGEINTDLLHPPIRKNGRIFFVTPIPPETAIKSAENAIKHILQNYPGYKVECIYLVDEPRMPKLYPKLETARLCWEINFFLGKNPPGAIPSKAYYYAYVDATTGEFIGGWLPE